MSVGDQKVGHEAVMRLDDLMKEMQSIQADLAAGK
jgi:hypothetical protein